MPALEKVIMFVSVSSSVLPLTVLMIRWRGVSHRYFYFLGTLVTTCFVADIACSISITFHQTTAYLLNLLDFFQFTFLLFIYKDFYLNDKRSVFLCILTGYFVFEVVNSLFFQGLTDHQTWSWTISGLILIGTSVGFYLDMLKKLEVDDILTYSPVWINASVIFYFSLRLYILVKADFIFNTSAIDTSIIFWGFNGISSLIKNGLLSMGIFFLQRPGSQQNK